MMLISEGKPNFVAVVRMIRGNRGCGFYEAMLLGFAAFDRYGWHIPESIQSMRPRVIAKESR